MKAPKDWIAPESGLPWCVSWKKSLFRRSRENTAILLVSWHAWFISWKITAKHEPENELLGSGRTAAGLSWANRSFKSQTLWWLIRVSWHEGFGGDWRQTRLEEAAWTQGDIIMKRIKTAAPQTFRLKRKSARTTSYLIELWWHKRVLILKSGIFA